MNRREQRQATARSSLLQPTYHLPSTCLRFAPARLLPLMPSATPALPRKRLREHASAQVANENDQCSTAKWGKTNTPRDYPPHFGDTLSKVHLTQRAFKELDYRCSPGVITPIGIEQRRR